MLCDKKSKLIFIIFLVKIYCNFAKIFYAKIKRYNYAQICRAKIKKNNLKLH